MKLANGVIAVELHEICCVIPCGYYMDSLGNIWSTRVCGESMPVKLAGTYTPTGRYFKLGDHQFRHDYLHKRARCSPIWNQTFMNPLPDALLAAASEFEFESESDVKKPVKGGYVIASLLEGALTFDGKPTVYSTSKEVEDEMARLARLNPGVTFVALKIEKAVTDPGLTWSS